MNLTYRVTSYLQDLQLLYNHKYSWLSSVENSYHKSTLFPALSLSIKYNDGHKHGINGYKWVNKHDIMKARRGKAGWWCQHTEIPFYGSVCSVHKSSSSQPRAQHLGNHSTSEWTQPAGNKKQAASDKQRQEQNNSMPGLNFREIALRLETNTNTLCYLWNLLTAFLKTVTHVNCELANDKSWILNLTSHSWGVRLDLRVCKPQYLILHISNFLLFSVMYFMFVALRVTEAP